MIKQIKQDFNYYKSRLAIPGLLKAIVILFLFHPGFQLLFSLRVQKMVSSIPFVGATIKRILWYFTSVWTSTEISVSAKIGGCVFFPHPTGIVIGDSWDIEDRVTIMQCVTLGRKNSQLKPTRRSIVGSDVSIGAGAKLIGEIDVGNNAVIGANAVVVKSVPEGATAVGVPAKIVEKHENCIH